MWDQKLKSQETTVLETVPNPLPGAGTGGSDFGPFGGVMGKMGGISDSDMLQNMEGGTSDEI